jgi:hypothetical protein
MKVYVILQVPCNDPDGVYTQEIHSVYNVEEAAEAECEILNLNVKDRGCWETLYYEVAEHLVL